MNKVLVLFLIIFMLLVGCSKSEEESIFDEDGNLNQVHSDAMLKDWCNNNEDRNFAESQCKEIWESD